MWQQEWGPPRDYEWRTSTFGSVDVPLHGSMDPGLLAHIAHEISEYEDLLVRLQTLQQDRGERRTMVELGAGVWADAVIPSTEFVTIEIGLGICVDMPIDDGVEFTKIKIASLQRRLSSVRGAVMS